LGKEKLSMTKQDILNQIQVGLETKIISQDEILSLFGAKNIHTTIQPKKLDFGNLISIVGGVIIFIGITSLVSIYWNGFSSLSKLAVTLGIGLITFALGSALMLVKKYTGLALHIISPFLLIFGSAIFVYEFILPSNPPLDLILLSNTITGFVFFGLYLAADLLLKSKFFSFVSWLTGAFSYWSLIFYCINIFGIPPATLYESKFFVVFALIYSLVISIILYLMNKDSSKKAFVSVAGFFETGFFLSYIFWWLQGNSILEIIFGLIVFLCIYLSTLTNKLSTLIATMIGLVLYFSYITSRYFVGVVGWPVSIIIMGIVLVGSGYAFINLKPRLSKK
jgi:hypothetical protein